MINFHPPLSSFPAVTLVLAVASELIAFFKRHNKLASNSYRVMAQRLIFIGCCFTCVTYLSGYFGEDQASQTFEVPTNIIATHQAWAKAILVSLIPLIIFTILRNMSAKLAVNVLYYFFLTLSLGLTIYTSYLGGTLVFKHGAGVEVQE